MVKRMILMLVLVTAGIGALAYVKFNQIQAAMAQGAAYQPPPEAVTTTVAQEERWPSTLVAIGTVTAVQGVTVSADLPGIVNRIAFESGMSVEEGDILVELDTRQEQAQLVAAEAERDLARLNFSRLEGLINRGAISRAEYDRAAAEQKRTEARVGEIRATVDRKTIRAPFSGVLGLRQVNLGQYLSAGDAVVTLQSLDPIYVNFGVPQQDIGSVQAGRGVTITVGEVTNSQFPGRISAINAVVDEDTRNVQVQATLANPRGTLRPGMFAQAQVALDEGRTIVTIPVSSISYAPYGDSVFVVNEMTNESGQAYQGVRQQFVEVGESRGDQIAILSGVEAGEEVVTSGAFKLRNGSAVLVNNEVTPPNEREPMPEDG